MIQSEPPDKYSLFNRNCAEHNPTIPTRDSKSSQVVRSAEWRLSYGSPSQEVAGIRDIES